MGRTPLVVAAVFFIAAACGPAATHEAGPHARPHEEGAARATPAPTLAWRDGAFDVQGLPAIANAGEVAVVVSAAPEHGQPALRVEVRNAADLALQTVIAVSAGDSDLAGKLAAANQALATLHGVHDLRPMRPLPVEPGHDQELAHWATGDNLDVEWRERTLSVFRHNITQPLWSRSGAAWAADPVGPCAGMQAAYLGAVYHVAPGTTLPAAGNALVVRLDFQGTAACPAPPSQLHVITWLGARG